MQHPESDRRLQDFSLFFFTLSVRFFSTHPFILLFEEMNGGDNNSYAHGRKEDRFSSCLFTGRRCVQDTEATISLQLGILYFRTTFATGAPDSMRPKLCPSFLHLSSNAVIQPTYPELYRSYRSRKPENQSIFHSTSFLRHPRSFVSAYSVILFILCFYDFIFSAMCTPSLAHVTCCCS